MVGLFVTVSKSDTLDYYEIKEMFIFDKEKNEHFKNYKQGESISYFSNTNEKNKRKKR